MWLPVVTVKGGGAQLLDNFLDFTHFPFIHAGTFGAGEDSFVGDYEVDARRRVAEGPLRPRRREQGGPGRRQRRAPPPPAPHHGVHVHACPFAGRLRLELPLTGVENTILFWASPVDADHSRVFCALLRNDVTGPDDPAAIAARDYEYGVLDRGRLDARAAPHHQPPPRPPAQAHTRADRITVEMRRLLAAMVA